MATVACRALHNFTLPSSDDSGPYRQVPGRCHRRLATLLVELGDTAEDIVEEGGDGAEDRELLDFIDVSHQLREHLGREDEERGDGGVVESKATGSGVDVRGSCDWEPL